MATQAERIEALESDLKSAVGATITLSAKLDAVAARVEKLDDALAAYDVRLQAVEEHVDNVERAGGTSPEVILLRRDLDDIRHRYARDRGEPSPIDRASDKYANAYVGAVRGNTREEALQTDAPGHTDLMVSPEAIDETLQNDSDKNDLAGG